MTNYMLLLYRKCQRLEVEIVHVIRATKTNVREREKPKRNNLTVCVLPVYR